LWDGAKRVAKQGCAEAGVMGKLILVEKRKWDGSVSAREEALLLESETRCLAWRVRAGTRRERPARGGSERVEQDELWLSPSEVPVVLCSYLTAENTVESYELHAACEATVMEADLLSWIDLDLDVILEDGNVNVVDEATFMEHARTMHYPERVVRAAWSGIAAVAPRFVNHEWPFDGSLDALAHAEVSPDA
jgi:hypothetical protein